MAKPAKPRQRRPKKPTKPVLDRHLYADDEKPEARRRGFYMDTDLPSWGDDGFNVGNRDYFSIGTDD